jgi:hypothetical protein
MKSCPVIVTEGEEAANHHSTTSERTRAKREMHGGPEGKTEAKWRRSIEDKGHLSDNAEADIITEGALHRRSEYEDDH